MNKLLKVLLGVVVAASVAVILATVVSLLGGGEFLESFWERTVGTTPTQTAAKTPSNEQKTKKSGTPAGAADKDKLEVVLVNAGAIIGQAIACEIPRHRLLPVMAAQAAAVEVFSNRDAKIAKLRDEIIFLAAENEKLRKVQRCGEIERAFSGVEQTFRREGIMK